MDLSGPLLFFRNAYRKTRFCKGNFLRSFSFSVISFGLLFLSSVFIYYSIRIR
ncbi:hypothetical protein LEP1GSC150_1549 [Leptospira interrogans serovar Copenhageni str. LT2050]|uniref:Uncharacterized protein n=1 Tax=Leptospira interrogans serovar Copenhageni str. LT2050 TaxID=1001598 RepID=M3H8F1_LEPIT|nr:hypothetical protein LEP1GSC150_1549 [Leptospira interrogans serovar Copenhageni str. LT2050]